MLSILNAHIIWSDFTSVVILCRQVRDKGSTSPEAGNLKNQLFEFLYQESVLPANQLEYTGLKAELPRIRILTRTKYGNKPDFQRLQGLQGTATRVLTPDTWVFGSLPRFPERR